MVTASEREANEFNPSEQKRATRRVNIPVRASSFVIPSRLYSVAARSLTATLAALRTSRSARLARFVIRH